MPAQALGPIALLALLTAYPFVSVWGNNLDEVNPARLVMYGAATCAGVAVAYIALFAIVGSRTRRVGPPRGPHRDPARPRERGAE